MTKDGQLKATIFAMQNGKALDPNVPVIAEIGKKTGVKLENVASQNETDENQAYTLMLTSNKLPDLISYYKLSDLEKLGAEGGVLELSKLVDEHASNIKAFFAKYPRFKKDAIAADGKMYVIPAYYDWYNLRTSKGFFIRKDWLKKLELQEPKTVDDLYNVLVAFRDKDPNGNGKKDEIPLFIRSGVDQDILFTLTDIFKATPSVELKDGKIVFGGNQEDYKVAIEKLAKWYKEGLIDKEVFTRKMAARDYMLSNNIGGFTIDWIGSTSGYNDVLGPKIKGFDFGIILPPVFNGIKTTRQARPDYEGGIAISKDAKDPVKMIEYLDYYYSPEGRRLWNFGREGKEYTLVDGKPVFTNEVMKDKDKRTPLQVLRSVGAQFRLGAPQDGAYELAWSSPAAKKGVDLYMSNNVVDEGVPPLKFTSAELQKLIPIQTQITQYETQKAQQWILGSSDVEQDWAAYNKRLNDLGLQTYLKIYNDAYARYMKQ